MQAYICRQGLYLHHRAWKALNSHSSCAALLEDSFIASRWLHVSCAPTNADRWQEGSHAQRQGRRVAELVDLLAIAQVWHAEDVLIDGARLHVVVISNVLIKMRPREDVIPATVHSSVSQSRCPHQQVTLHSRLHHAMAKGNDEEAVTNLSRMKTVYSASTAAHPSMWSLRGCPSLLTYSLYRVTFEP